MKKNLLFVSIISIFFSVALSQVPPGYYDDAAGLEGTELRAALHDIIDDHTFIQYGDIYDILDQTDMKPNGKVWDMYSDVPGGTPPYEYTFFEDECGNYSGEGSCYNKEHSWPKSWFGGEVYPMHSDLFHIVPTDGYVNGKRSNYPFGEVGAVIWTSQNGSKTGYCNYPGYSGIVFEPIDAYKGDFARGYFYMSTRYYGEDSGWPGSDMVEGAELKPWALSMLLEWHYNDPLSQKEIDRCNAIYNLQNNRNPFIDHPEYVALIWDPDMSIEEAELSQYLHIYLSKNSKTLHVNQLKGKNELYELVLYDISGKKVFESTMANDHIEINIGKHAAGAYILQIKNVKSRQMYQYKIIK
jgi:endonuclease I